MRNLLHRLTWLLGALLLLATTAQAEVYRWTDERGRIHFEDRPPDSLPTRKVEEVKLRRGNVADPLKARPVQPIPADEPQEEPAPTAPPSAAKKEVGVAARQTACAAHKQAYEASKACFLGCTIFTKTGGSTGMNNSHCGHCTDVVMPHC